MILASLLVPSLCLAAPMTTIYSSQHAPFRVETAMASSAAIRSGLAVKTLDANRTRLHHIRCIPCAVVEDEKGLVGIVEWDGAAPRADALSPKVIDAMVAARDARLAEAEAAKVVDAAEAETQVDALLRPIQDAKDLDTMKAEVLKILRNVLRR
jgi:hypothetical protein